MTRIRFHRKLDDLKERLLVMAGMAEQAIQRAVEAYRVRDISLCDLVVRSEVSINSFEREIDQMALDLLAIRIFEWRYEGRYICIYQAQSLCARFSHRLQIFGRTQNHILYVLAQREVSFKKELALQILFPCGLYVHPMRHVLLKHLVLAFLVGKRHQRAVSRS